MRLQILTLVCSLFVLVLATGKVEDKDNIRDLFSAYAFTIDERKFDQYDKILTRDVTFEVAYQIAGITVDATFESFTIKGIAAIAKYDEVLFPETVKSYAQPTANLIKFLPPYDRDGRSDRAEAVSYTSFIFFGAGNSTKEVFIPLRYFDREIVRTKERGFGGWRIKNRKIELVVIFREELSETPPF